MNQPDHSTYDQTLQVTFDRLAGCIEQAQLIAPVVDVDQLLQLLPQASAETQRFILSELIKLDMNAAADAGQLRLLDFYLPNCAHLLGDLEIPLDLVLEELQVRRDYGQSPQLVEYQQRFPRWAMALADFQWDKIDSRRTNELSGLPELETNQYIDDFRILHTLGSGAFARVYLAVQESMNRLVALKVSARGTDEPQTLSQLDHPNIVRVYDQRKLNNQQVHLLYMQAVLGGTVSTLVKETHETPLQELSGRTLLERIDQSLIAAQQQPPEREAQDPLYSMDWPTTVVWLGQQLADGLQSAHDRGVFHRDVKPANILLSAEGRPKLADFNVSHSAMSEKRGSAVGGTLAYMAPEHLCATDVTREHHQPVDHRSDLYSLAVVLWELWQGNRPWSGAKSTNNWQDAIEHHLSLRQLEPQQHKQDPSPAGQWLYRVLRQSLSVDPARRPQSCSEFAQRLRLAMHPELTARFAPPLGSTIDRIRKLPIVLITALIILIPNAFAAVLNFVYNERVIISKYSTQMGTDFVVISWWINSIAFSLGAVVLLYFCWRVRQCLNRADANLPPSLQDIDWVWRFGHRSALIGVAFWLSFGLIFPMVIQLYQPDFRGTDFTHFFLSLTICGGIAWIYPYYGVSLLSAIVYYPQILSPTMDDPEFTERANWMRRCSDFYLASSAVVPLMSLFLIITRADSEVPSFLKLLLVVLTLLSVVFSFKAYQVLQRVIDQYDTILGQSRRS